MEYKIITTYCRDDFKGLYNAFLSGKINKIKYIKILRIIVLVNLSMMCLGSLLVFFFDVFVIHRLTSAPLILFFIFLGLIINLGFDKGKLMWRSYPYKGQQQIYHFYSDYLIITNINSEIKTSYTGIKSLYEDKLCFYLFITSREAYIIPKRDIKTDYDSFYAYIETNTGLQINQI